jgi:hypothetical protein
MDFDARHTSVAGSVLRGERPGYHHATTWVPPPLSLLALDLRNPVSAGRSGAETRGAMRTWFTSGVSAICLLVGLSATGLAAEREQAAGTADGPATESAAARADDAAAGLPSASAYVARLRANRPDFSAMTAAPADNHAPPTPLDPALLVIAGLFGLPFACFALVVLFDGLVATGLLVSGTRAEGEVLESWRRFGVLPRIRYAYGSERGFHEGVARGRGTPGERIAVRYAAENPRRSRPEQVLLWDLLALLSFTSMRLVAVVGYAALAIADSMREKR